ncbi:histone deacetylase superfamily [Choiromyces venosus 120613-1]|uniref:histone deacetylase n=1 Tax=Choiromyces venosus 120613-1 TaxID=1336337 RepID=A0A3N4JS36_9PEZI|nr:histone deacetylase superfamily [Choiromyces venosus 120613-1]
MSTGLCYDRRMTSHCILDGEHPEDPKRISAIYTIIVRNGLVNDPELSGASNPEDPGLMVRIEAREATKREICLIHDRDQFEFAQRLEDLDDDELINLTRDADSVYFNQYTFICAKLSCGGVIETCLRVAQGHLKNAIAVVRPPGHHATPHNAMGFCIFNNVCVAAKVLQARVPSVKKILILDWDIHHGNGTQDAFYSDPSVLYISLHRFEKGNFYPNDPKGDSKFCGKDQGTGFNVNIPWTEGGKLDGDYLWAFQKLVMPIALEYNPDFVIVSAGFDAAAGDELGECYITPVGFAHMTHMLMGLAKGKMAVCLEGGYNLSSISDSALAVIKVLMGQAPEKLLEPPVASPAAAKVVQECINIQMRYWRWASVRGNGLSLNVRAWQEKILWEKYKITKVPIMHPSRLIYENAVLMS